MKKIAFTLALILTTLSLFGCTSNNNQSTPPPVSPPLNEIYFAGSRFNQYDKTYILYFNYIYIGKDNLNFGEYVFSKNNTINFIWRINGYECFYDAPDFITPYSTLTTAYTYGLESTEVQEDILRIEFMHAKQNPFEWETINVLDAKEFNLSNIIKILQLTDSSADSH